MAVGNKIFELRKAAGLSQEQAAEKLSVSRQTISKWESGASAPDLNNIIALSKLFNVSADYLLTEDADREEIDQQAKTNSVNMTSDNSNDEGSTADQNKKQINKKKRAFIWIISVVALAVLVFLVYKYSTEKPAADASELANSVLFLELYDDADNVIGSASGVPLDSTTIATNCHVIDGTYKIIAYNSNGVAESEINTILAYSETEDLAILQCENELTVHPLKLGNSDAIKQGDKVFAIGYPLGLSNTLTDGIVSSRHKDNNGVDVLQITAPISPGSSGGALISEEGVVVGIVCASYENGQNMNLAIPSNNVLSLLDNQNGLELSAYYEQTLSGYAALNSFKHVDFEELCNNPSKYNGKNITVTGYVAMRSVLPENLSEGPTEPTTVYIVPSIEDLPQWESMGGYITSKDVLSSHRLYFTDFEKLRILEAQEPLYSMPNTYDDSLVVEPGEYVAVTGVFHYRQAEKNNSGDGTVSSAEYSFAYMDLTNVTIIDA